MVKILHPMELSEDKKEIVCPECGKRIDLTVWPWKTRVMGDTSPEVSHAWAEIDFDLGNIGFSIELE